MALSVMSHGVLRNVEAWEMGSAGHCCIMHIASCANSWTGEQKADVARIAGRLPALQRLSSVAYQPSSCRCLLTGSPQRPC